MDPLSNVALNDKTLVCNYALKSVIQKWMEETENDDVKQNCFKIIIIWNKEVEKHAFVKRYVSDFFEDHNSRSIVGIDFQIKNIKIYKEDGTERKIQLEIWDSVVCYERFLSISCLLYHRNADGVIILCDENKYESIHDMEKHFEKANHDVPNAKKMIVGLISEKDNVKEKEAIISIADRLQLEYFFVQLEDKSSVKKPFDRLVEQFLFL